MAKIVKLLALVAMVAAAFSGAQLAHAQDSRSTGTCHLATGRDAWVTPVCIRSESFDADVCAAIVIFARHWRLPEGFFARLIWQESRFNPNAASWAGAQGIAQFMPGTARIRGLENAFDPAEALARSAEYLRFLTDKFGSLGLAAAAYNAGEGRMSRVLAGQSSVPLETRDYVQIITGRPVDRWVARDWTAVDYTLNPDLPFAEACTAMASARPMPRLALDSADWQPWGVLLGQDFSPEVARGMFERAQSRFSGLLGGEEPLLLRVRNPSFGNKLRYSAMVGRDSRGEAEELCNAIQAAGGSCIVVKNREG